MAEEERIEMSETPQQEGPIISSTEVLLSTIQMFLEFVPVPVPEGEEPEDPPKTFERIRISIVGGDLTQSHSVTFGYLTPEFAIQIGGALLQLAQQALQHREAAAGIILATPESAKQVVKRAEQVQRIASGKPPGANGRPNHG